MALENYVSHCDIHQRIINCRDKQNKQKYVANNVDSNDVYLYLFDGEVVKEGMRCDYLLFNDTKRRLYFVELKGSDLSYALKQIDESVRICKNRFKNEIKQYQMSFRVVLNKVRSPKLYTNDTKRFMRNVGSDLKFKSIMLEEEI